MNPTEADWQWWAKEALALGNEKALAQYELRLMKEERLRLLATLAEVAGQRDEALASSRAWQERALSIAEDMDTVRLRVVR